MKKLLIVEDNIMQSKQIINYVSQQIPTLKLYSMCYLGKEAINILKKEKVDIIILDLVLPDLSGIEILNFIYKNNLKNYRNSIIIVSGNTQLIPELVNFESIYKVMPKPLSLEDLSKNIISLLSKKVEQKKDILIIDKIKKELENLNYNFSHNGTRYLLEVVFELYKVRYNFNSNLEDNLKKNVYPIIAKRHNKTTDTVYCNIKQATKQMYEKSEKKFINNYFHCRC